MHFLGLTGMPRRVADYSVQYTDFNMMASIGAFILGAAQVIFLYNIIMTVRGGKKASDKVWEGAQGLEWSIPSPAPYHTFQRPPVVT